MENECKGCKAYSKGGKVERLCGLTPKISETKQCPCRLCLVKVTCEDEVCEEFNQYVTECEKENRWHDGRV